MFDERVLRCTDLRYAVPFEFGQTYLVNWFKCKRIFLTINIHKLISSRWLHELAMMQTIQISRETPQNG